MVDDGSEIAFLNGRLIFRTTFFCDTYIAFVRDSEDWNIAGKCARKAT